jgi:hypothetical protein
MRELEEWLAASATGSFIKISIGAALGAALSWLTTSDIHPLIVAMSAAVIPIIINTVNPQDPHYGTVNWEDLDE